MTSGSLPPRHAREVHLALVEDRLGRVANQWPLEGHFACGAWGLGVTLECLGRAFTSRTLNDYNLTISLPQRDPAGELVAPAWTYGPRDERERSSERDDLIWAMVLNPEFAIVERVRFYTTLTASSDDEFQAAVDDFREELEDWWIRFTSWVGVLTSQEFDAFAESRGDDPEAESWLAMWTGNADGQRATDHSVGLDSSVSHRLPMDVLDFVGFQACVSATGRQVPLPATWDLIRDARLGPRAGQFRRAVLDAGTAAELAVIALIDKYLDDGGVDQKVQKALRKRYTTLGQNAELLKALRPDFPLAKLRKELIAPRNEAAHGDYSPAMEEAQSAVEAANEIAELLSR
jgi:hypothetical protein